MRRAPQREPTGLDQDEEVREFACIQISAFFQPQQLLKNGRQHLGPQEGDRRLVGGRRLLTPIPQANEHDKSRQDLQTLREGDQSQVFQAGHSYPNARPMPLAEKSAQPKSGARFLSHAHRGVALELNSPLSKRPPDLLAKWMYPLAACSNRSAQGENSKKFQQKFQWTFQRKAQLNLNL